MLQCAQTSGSKVFRYSITEKLQYENFVVDRYRNENVKDTHRCVKWNVDRSRCKIGINKIR